MLVREKSVKIETMATELKYTKEIEENILPLGKKQLQFSLKKQKH